MAENGAATENGAAEPATGRDPVDLPLAVVDDVATTPVLLMVHTDHLGRPIRMTDGSKATVWAASWKPWGEPQSISGTKALNLRFPGQYFQIETSLAYNWHRHYDTTTGRYTQPDPLGFVDGPSIYAYASNSPFMYTDREGRQQVRSTRGGRSSLFEPSPMQQFYQGQYTYLRNQVWRYDPNYQEFTSSDFRPNLGNIRRLEDYLRSLQNGAPPTGGVYGLFGRNSNFCWYAGRTDTFIRRKDEWSAIRPNLRFSPIFPTNHPLQQRGMEQRYKDILNPPLNIRNPVGPRNSRTREILDAIQGFEAK
jgi:RHS repeat-associated protein